MKPHLNRRPASGVGTSGANRWATVMARVWVAVLACGCATWVLAGTSLLAQSPPFDHAGAEAPPDNRRPVERPLPIPGRDLELPGDAPESVAQAPELELPVVEVRITGNVTIPNSEITKHIKTRPGRPLSQKLIREDVDALVRTRWFTTVDPSVSSVDGGLSVTFRLVERPIVRSVEYRGNRRIKTDKLAAITNLKVGSPYDVSANRECVRRIEDHYREKGYAFAKVELVSGTDPDDREVVFEIDEGPKAQVVSIRFEGNEAFSDAILSLHVQTKKRIVPYFGGKWDPSTVPNDIAGVSQYYRNLGYFDVEIDHQVGFSEDKSQVTLIYTVREGMRYRLRNLVFAGNQIASEETLRGFLKVKSGDYFDARQLNIDVEKMRSLYGEQGRLFAKVDAIPTFLEEPGQVDLEFRIDEDKVYRVRELNVHMAGDHPHTKLNLVRNMSRIQPGDLANPEQIRKTRRWLEGSGYFETGGENGPRLEITRVDEPGWLGPASLVATRSQSQEFPEPLSMADEFLARTAPREVDAPGHVPYSRTTSKQPTSATANETATATRAGEPAAPVPNRRPVEPRSVPAPRRSPSAVTQEAGEPLTQAGYSPARLGPARPLPATSANLASTRAPASNMPARGAARSPQAAPATSLAAASSVVDDDEDPGVVPLTAAYQEALQEATIRAQSSDPLAPPANPLWDNSPQGDPFGNAIRDPEPNLWQQMPPPEFIDIDAYLTEARTGRIMFGVGVNSDSGVIGNIVLQENNFDLFRPPMSMADIWNGTAFRGAGQKFRLEAVPGQEVSRYLVDWSDPYIFDTDYNLGVSGFYFNRYYRDWDEDRLGGRIRLGRQFTPNWSASFAVRLEDVNLSTSLDPRAELLTESLGSNFLSTVRATLMHDTRDAAQNPTTGHLVEFAVEQAFAEYDYTRFEVEGSQFFTTYQRADGAGKHVLTLRGNVGFTSNDTPIYERFYAGGFQTFRGFAFRGVTPIETNTEIGGQFMLLGTVEYMLPIVANEMFKGVVFSDFGTVDEDVSLDQFRVAVGAGFRVAIPALGPVPLAFDFTVPVVKQDFDDTQVFSFYVGWNR